MLNTLIRLLKKRVGKPQWTLTATKTGNIKRRDFSGSIESPGIWQTVTRLLESGQLSLLGQCLECLKFFNKRRYRQACCDPKTCGKIYDNRRRVDVPEPSAAWFLFAGSRVNVDEVIQANDATLKAMEPYKNYWISGWTLTVQGYGSDCYARGNVCNVEPSGRTIVLKSVNPKEIFSNKEEAEAFGLKLSKRWVDEKEVNDDFRIWTQCFGSKSF